MGENGNEGEIQGYLLRLDDSTGGLTSSSSPKAFWAERFFAIGKSCRPMLHQYDSELQWQRKSVSANKKNRLPLTGCVVSPILSSPPDRCNNCNDQSTQLCDDRYEFSVSALGGRVSWTLAARTSEEQAEWMKAIENAGQR